MAIAPPTTEIGSASGVGSVVGWSSLAVGLDSIERVPELQWPNSAVTYGLMMNDAQVYSLVQSLIWPIRSYRWYLEPNGARPEVIERISRNYNLPVGEDDAFNRRRGQRRFSFDKHLEDALRALVYGHMFFEQVGEVEMEASRLVWNLRKLGIRGPRTLSEINVDEDGGLSSIRQVSGDPTQPPIPVSRLVAYVWDREGSNWAGRSMLRSLYRNHLVKDRVLRVGAINIERAGGVPYANAPENASPKLMAEIDGLMRRFRVGEAAGVALPHGVQMKFAAAAGGDGAVSYIKLQNEEMARAFLQMVNMLGQTETGSRALGKTFDSIADVAQFMIAKWFADTFNEHMIEDDVEWNEGPEEEFAPLLAFDAGGADPLEGFSAAEGADDGLMLDPGGEVAATLGLRHRRYPARTRAERRGDGQRRTGGVSAATDASPVLLPPRPLRRQPYDHEIRAAVDYASMDSAYNSALDLLVQEVRALQAYQVDELRDAIVSAAGKLDDIAELSAAGAGMQDVIASRLNQVAEIAAAQAAGEAVRQGVNIKRPPLEAIQGSLRNRAEAVDSLLTANLAQTASRHALRLTGGGLSAEEVADATRTYLSGLSGTYLRDMLGGAVQTSINAARKEVFSRDGQPGEIFASELLDENTCPACTAVDGTPYASMDEAERDYPTGGYADCDGRERCRGTLVKVYEEA